MGIYRIYPQEDTFISDEPTISGLYRDAGGDPINEIGGYPDLNKIGRTKRLLIKFKDEDIDTGLNLSGINFTSSLNLYSAHVSELPVQFTLSTYPVSSSWQAGISQHNDEPVRNTGTNWIHRRVGPNLQWDTPGGDYIDNYSSSINFNNPIYFDARFDLTEYIQAISGSVINNHGVLVKLESALEGYTSQSINLQFYSSNTHTIYKPYLEFAWNDSTYDIGSLEILNSDVFIINSLNLKEEYKNSGKSRIRITARPQYPDRAFSTSSTKTNYVLPETSYYSIVDDFTGEVIVDYNDSTTKISADNKGSYFDFYMNSLSPERYYRVNIKVEQNGIVNYVEDNKTFKVVR